MSKESQKWLGTNSPFKGIFVYDAAAMGLRNMAEYLEEVVSRVVGDMLAEGVLAKLSDDLFVGGNTVQETLSNWDRLLQRLQENNLFLSADKTFICPSSIKVIGWVWKQGSIAVDHHRVNPLTTCPLPTNVKQLRSFIGAFRAISICIRGYANYLNFLEDMAAGKESSEKLLWNETMTKTFHEAQNALRRPQVLTLPHPEDQLILISDGCNSPPAVGSTLFIKRGSKEYIAGFFSAKIKKYQLLWLPCEVEALCINLTINSFSHYIRESKHTTKFLTDSKSCVQAFEKLAKGGFSLSPRISSFLMNLNALNVSINHIAGTSIPLTDFCSRNPVDCSDKGCQVCSFVEESADVEINALSLEEVLSGTSRMPFLNANTWMKLQKDDPDLRRAFSQLTGGTRPGKKEKRLKQLRRYLLIASVSNNGTLIRRKPNPYGRDLELIIVPEGIVSGLIAALHIRFGHPLKSQMRKVWDRYFFALDVDKFLDECMLSCSLCMSLKKLPKELIQQSTSDVPCTVGKVFSADVIRRENQKILILLDIFSSFKVGSLISNEQENTLQQSLIQLASTFKHPEGCVIKVDHAPGFQALRNDKVLASVGIELDFGRLKNKNQNPTIDKSIQEVEYEIKCLAPSGGAITPGLLATALCNSNHRIRANGLSAKEVVFKRENFSSEPIKFDDNEIRAFKYEKRLQNHPYSERCKSRNMPSKNVSIIVKGDIVHIKSEGSKHKARELYLVTSVDYKIQMAEIQKFTDSQLRQKRYEVKFSEIFVVQHYNACRDETEYGEEDEEDCIPLLHPAAINHEEHIEGDEDTSVDVRRSNRIRRQPDWLATGEIERIG